ncbi:DUF1542 domain-containing protein [Limosilactobacillus reuteri]|uniref:DUF1542 domain-containing protein n=11 Tax=Limosilactobacillus reuteri TaxID=1598 RepID=UPI001CDB60F0|nr:DUF1542 domain-containing protein [Limosilactobacillus reuteri]
MANHLMLFAAVRGSGVATLNEAEDPNAVTVNDAKGFINAIQNGTATTINVAKDLNLAEQTDSKYTEIKIKNKRDIVIQSDNPEEKRTIDFSGYSFDMDTQNSVTFKDLNIYARSYWGLVYNAGGYTFDNVNFTGSQLIYTKPWINSTLTFKNNITANSVSSYVGPLDGKTRDTQQNGGQQILQFEGGTNQIIFDENSNVTLTTEDANALEIDGGTTTIDVKDGANVAINPHSKGDPESRNGIGTGDVARAIAANAKMTINIDPNSTLTINTEKVDGDKDVAGALYLNSDAALNVNGKLVINSNGTPSANKSNGVPVYINGSAKINVGNGGSFSLDATNLGNYSSSLISINGKGSVKLDPHSSFKISGDGTGALTAINLSSGSTFTSDQPDSFTIDLSANTSTGKSLIKNGAINFTRVKAVTDGNESQPLGKIDVTYDRNGNAKSYIITAQDENTVKQVGEGLTNKNLIDLVKAGEDVTLSNLHLSKNNVLTGTVASSGSNNPIYVTVTVGGVSTNVPVLDHYTVYTNTNGIVTSNNIDYAAQTASTGGNFSIDLSKLASSLTDDTQVKVTATKDFVEGAQTESVAALRALNTTTLQELVDAALAEKAKPSYYNATAEAQKAYTDAISTGKTILANQNNYDQVDVDNAVTAIQKAQKALTGEPTNKTELQQAVDQASSVEASDNYTNADSNLQKAYTDAISAGQTVLSNDNATQTEVDNVLTTINNAKDALNGDAKKAASKAALQKAVDEAPTVKSDDAAYYNGSTEAKTAYDDAITAGQTVLDNPAATATQITDALNAINTAKGNLKGEATDKSALQTAVDNSTTVKESNNYTNADADLQKAYTDAISAGQTVLSNDNATQTEVDNALTTINNAKDALNGDAKKAASKEALQKAVDEAPTVKSDDAAYYNGSTEAKTAYDDAITAGQTVLDNPAATATQITDALNAINTAKGNLKGEATDKSALQTAVDNSTTVKESNNYTNADQTQKTAYDKAVTDAQTVLDKTNATQAEVNQALQDLETANNNLNGNAKTEAANKAALEAAVKDAPNVRNTPAYYNGSEEAKKTYNDAINAGQAVLDQANPSASEVKNALNAINAAKDNLKGEATSTEALKTALTNANDAKETGNYTNADQANQEALNNAINAGQDLLKNTNATQAEVDSAAKAITAAINGMNGDTNLAKAKTAATEDIQKALDTKTTQITDANNIDQTTKDQLIADAKKAAEDANTAINQVTDPNAVNTAKTEGIANINKVTVPSLEDAKTKAAKEIDQALTDKTKAITDAENIDQTTKDQLIKEATDAANTAKDAIEKSTTNDEATKAGQAGVDAINNVKVPSVTDSQNAAKEVIDNALNSKTKEINAATNIDQTTKDQLIKEATDAANNAKEAIDKASTAEAIKTAQDEGTTKINNVTVPSLEDAKKAATKAVDDALAAQTEVINKANNLSDAEKKDLIDQATAEANKAKENIETATTNNEAAQAAQAGVDAIKKIVPTSLDTVKSDANKAIDDALTKKLEKINSANDLTADEKTALTQEANTVADKAKEEITNATTNDAVIEAQNNGVTAIDDIKVPTESAVKEAAKKAVADAATAKNNAIDASNLTDEEKAALKQKVTDAQNAADQEIDKATTNAAVTEAQTNGVNAINGIEVTTSTAKEAAKKVVAEAATAKNNAIDASNLTAEEKAALKQKVTEAQDSADQAIDKATTDAAVTEAQTNGVNAINGIEVTTSTAKEAAKKVVAEAATAKNNAIDASNLTAEEKAALKQKVTEAQDSADQAIDKATTDAAVTEAQTNGVNAINGIEVTTSTAKEAAKKVVAEAATAKNNAIDASNLTAEEKAALKQKVTEAQKAADQAIDNATTDAAVTEAQTNGVTTIDDIKVPTESAVKEAAKQAVADAATAKNNAIDSSNLTAEEKAALKQKVTDAQTVADQAIDKATTNAAVIEAQTNGVNAIDDIKVPTESAAKQAAKEAVADAATAKNNAIDSSNLTAEEKAALKQKVTDAQTVADQAIDKATTNAAVIEAQTNGVNAIDDIKVPTESAAKQAAKEAVADAATAKNNAIDSSNLTAEEKAALKQKVTDAQTVADQAIDKATTNAAVTEAQTNGVNAINGIKVPTTSATKEQAITDLNTAVDDAKKAIDQDNNLTDEQKQAAKDQINSDAKTAQDAINNAKTNDDVKKAAADGTLAIDKDVANAAIDNAVAGKKAEISNSPLTDEEKTALNNEVAQKANSAREAINNATTPEAVATAQEDGVKNITDTEVPSESAAKQAAKKAVAKAADEKNTAIDSSNLTDEEKAALKQKVTDAQNAADQAIDNAKTNAAVTEAKDKGIKNINDIDVPSKSDAKEKAVTDLNTAVENAKKAIDQDSNLTDEQKQAAKDQIDSDAKTAQEAINNAKTDNDVNNAVNSGKVSIDKDVANAAIDNAVAGKLKEIQDPLTTEEKQAYTDLINSEANNAKQNIANATTVEEVTTAQTNGVNEINNTGIPTTSSAKEKAIAAINDALQTKTDEINNASNINTQEKTDLINQATEAANAAKNNINNATTNTDVDTAQTNGEKAIADVTVPNLSDVKKESIDLINKALDAKTDEINNASNLSQDEKQGLINTATNAATEAINNVNQAQTNDDAKAAATTGVQNIENITIPTLDEAKKNANQAIDDALNSKVNEINNASNLNETEKQKLVDQANEAAATAKNNVEKATTNDDARDAANAGIDNIKGITFTSLEDAKNAANTAIDNALQVKTDEINNASNLSTDEKQDLINQATEVAKNAKDNINNATTNDAVTEAQNKGIADIANVTVPSLDQVKQDAINAIKQVQDAKNKQISAASNLSAEEQKELTDQVDKIANDAIAKINDAATTTNDAVNATRDDAIKQITDLFIPTLDGAQTDAINAIESAKNAKLNDINNAAHLTDQEKQALVDQTNKAADEATKAIKAAQTNDEVKSAETAGLDNINNITIPTLVQKQQEAIEELNAARDAKNSAIDNAADLTTDEKNALKDKVQVEYSNAVSNITSATTDEAVTTAKEDGITAIKDIQIPTKSPTKEQATSDLTTAVDEAKNAIDQDSNLTDEEKQAAKDQIDSDAQKAQEAIDNAKTADEVKTAVDNGQLAIDKDVANAAIDNAVAGKKAEISKSPLTDEEKTALNNEVDQKAQDAKEAINNATTPEAVTTAQENGIKNITNTEVPTESTAKEAAKKAIAEAAEAKNNAIDSSNLTDEEKAALKQEVTDAQNAADKAIDNATTNAAVTEAEDNGIKAINGIEIPAKSPAKEQATTDLNDAVDDAKKAIDQDSNLTDAEKQAAKDQIDSDAKKAQEAIDNAVAGKKAEIAKAPLTTDEANALNDLVDQEAKVAKNAIDSATTIPAVEDAKNTGVAAINDIAVPTTSSTKDQANQTIDDALANKIKEINDATNLSDKQKQDLIDQANNAANTAKDNITKATSDSEVATATTDGIDAIANVTVPSLETAKDQAKDLIDDVINEKKNEINNADNLSDSQKQDLINQATDEADQAKKNIDNATTNNDVQTAEDNGAQAIENVTVPSLDEAKKASTKVIDEVLKEKTAEINAATNLSNAEKDALIKDATTAANTAKDNIAKATTNDAVKDAETDGVKAILDIKVPGREDQQKDAIAALDRALADKVSEIDNANNLSETTKQDLKQQAQAAYTTAVDNVNNAQTSAEINAARDNGIQAILDITVPTLTDAQDASITAVEQVRDAKKTQIEAAKNLTETQKEALKNQVDEIADKAIDNIKNATTDATVKDAETAGINEILNVTIPTLDAAKSDAKQAIADALTAKTAEINAAQNLTDAEKQKLIDQAQTEAAAANKNIDAATTNDAAELAAKNGVQAILDIQVPTVEETRDQAKKNVDNALNSKKEEINNSNLSPAAKEALINEAEQAAENARTAIDNATTASAISEAEAAGIAAIENIKVSNAPTESDNPSNNQTNTETPTESNSTSQNNNNATQAPVQGNNTQTDLTGSHGTNLTTGQQTEKAADTNSKETLPQTGNETERGLSIAGLAIASLLGLFGLSGLGKKRD